MRAVLLILLLACGTLPPSNTTGCPAGVLVVTEAPDFSASGVGVLPSDGTPAELLFGSSLGSDPALATSAGRHFFIARNLDVIFETDPCGRGIGQYSARAVGESTKVNPQDVAVGPDGALWIPRFNVASLLVLGAQKNNGTPTVIDMSAFDTDGDGSPEMSSVRIVGGNAFVALERITKQAGGNYVSQQQSQMAVLDALTLALVKSVPLAGRNPFGLMTESNGVLWLADIGNISDAAEPDAGIEVFDTKAITSKLLFTEPALGGSAIDVAVNGTCGAAVVADATAVNRTSLVSFSIDGTNLRVALPPTAGYDLRGLIWTPAKLLLADKRGPPYVVHTFTADNACTLTSGPDLSVPSMPVLAFAN